jgi:hypothetical protein
MEAPFGAGWDGSADITLGAPFQAGGERAHTSRVSVERLRGDPMDRDRRRTRMTKAPRRDKSGPAPAFARQEK